MASPNDQSHTQSCDIGLITKPTIIYEDNSACIAQMNACYVKSNITKHIALKLFYPNELQKNGDMEILQIKSCDNLADLSQNPYLHQYFKNMISELV
jgi:hypothetical protein